MANPFSRRRSLPEQPTGSMADIAFLLLIFFFLTTTILNEKGILVLLPRWSDEPPPTAPVNENNVLTVLINSNNQLFVEGEVLDISDLKEKTKTFLLNPNQLQTLPESPDDAIVSLTHDRGTNYEAYLEVYNEIKAAYNECRDEAARRRFKRDYADLPKTLKQIIIDEIPMKFSEAEPTGHGQEG